MVVKKVKGGDGGEEGGQGVIRRGGAEKGVKVKKKE